MIDRDLVDPADFVGPEGRLLIDTSVFMDARPQRRGGLKALLERCAENIRLHNNPIVIPTDVVEELTRQSRKVDPERAEAIRRAGVALGFLEDAESLGLVRTDIGHDSKHYADSVFEAIFTRYANQYDLCLIINDITPPSPREVVVAVEPPAARGRRAQKGRSGRGGEQPGVVRAGGEEASPQAGRR